MRALLILLLLAGMASDVLLFNLSAAPGLSVQNGLLYVTALFLIYHATSGQLKVELRTLQVSFLVLIAYSLITYIVAAFIIRYPGYGIFKPLMQLKNGLIDYLVLFGVFFYGTRTALEALSVIKVLLLIVLLGNAAILLDVYGFIDSPAIYLDEGRLEGPFGPPNQHAAFILLILPAIAAFIITERDALRLFWMINAFICVVTLLMGVSRGAFVGAVIAGIWGSFLLRRFVSLRRIVVWTGAACVIAVAAMLSLDEGFSELLEKRLDQTSDIDAQTATSGRTTIWSITIGRMLETPLSLITGFGWDVYRSMPFRVAPHNHYLWFWFNVGIVGVATTLVIFTQIIKTARKAALAADAALRPHVMACVFGFIALSIALFFTEIYRPWLYIWAYVGLVMRVSVSALKQAVAPTVLSAASMESSVAAIAGVRSRTGAGRTSRR